jgi:hypothetical protein
MLNKVSKYVKEIKDIANDDRHGYSQTNRWNYEDFDCSSLVITVVENSGIPVKQCGATYTGNMLQAFTQCGFKDVTQYVNLATGTGLETGDILLTPFHHTEIYIGSGKRCGAHKSETGGKTGKVGDQTGDEISIKKYSNYPWKIVLRYFEPVDSTGVKVTTRKRRKSA